MATSIPFIDAHHHLWDLDTFSPSWLAADAPGNSLIDDYSPIQKPYEITDLLRDFEGSKVIKSVHIQTGYSDIDPTSETAWLQSIADKHGFPHGIIAYADLTSENVASDLETHLEHPNMRGVRNLVEPAELLAPAFDHGLSVLEDMNLVYDLSVTWEGMEIAKQVASAHPNLQFVLGHTGMPIGRSDEYFERWSGGLDLLSQAPNVAIKISGLGLADHNWSVDSIRPYVLKTIESFGVDQCMFGTNWPVDKLFSSYRMLIDAYRSIVSTFSSDEQNALLWENAERHYRLA
ncbi:MAG TPA: amidohydrolase family protein [Acidimicrobiia bacterium]